MARSQSFSISEHSHLVSMLKVGLVITIFLMVLALIIWPILQDSRQKRFTFSFSDIEMDNTPLTPKMINPRLHGVDSQHQPYNILADEITQEDQDHLRLTHLNADMTLSGNRWVSLLANEGFFTLSTKVLNLNGDVNIFFDDGFELRTNVITVNIPENAAYANQPVQGQGPPGTITANRMQVIEHGNIIRFEGDVTLTIFPYYLNPEAL